MYVYYCNAILKVAMKNRSDKEMIWSFIELTEDLKRSGINQVFHFMDNDKSTAFKITMTTIEIK